MLAQDIRAKPCKMRARSCRRSWRAHAQRLRRGARALAAADFRSAHGQNRPPARPPALPGRADLHDLPFAHHGDPVGKKECLCHVMGDEQLLSGPAPRGWRGIRPTDRRVVRGSSASNGSSISMMAGLAASARASPITLALATGERGGKAVPDRAWAAGSPVREARPRGHRSAPLAILQKPQGACQRSRRPPSDAEKEPDCLKNEPHPAPQHDRVRRYGYPCRRRESVRCRV